jgi:P27 family predicted phage terminase small subunit
MSLPLSREELKLHGYSNAALKKLSARKADGPPALEAGKPEPPPHLSDAECEVWDTTLALLEERGTLTNGDGPALALYAQAVIEHRAEREQLKIEGRITVVNRLDKHGHNIVIHAVNPRVRVVRDLENQLVLLLRELGLTPLRRHQVRNTRQADGNPGEAAAQDVLSDMDRILVKGTGAN